MLIDFRSHVTPRRQGLLSSSWAQEEEDDAVIFGSLVMVLKTLVIVTGMQLMRYGSIDNGTGRQPWIRAFGMLLALLVGPIMEACAYAFATQSLLAPINGLDLIWNILLSPFVLNERLTGSRIAGTMLVFLGSVVAPISGPHESAPLDLDHLQQIFLSSNFFVYSIVFVALAAFGFVELQRRQCVAGAGEKHDVTRGLLLGVGGGALAGQNYFLRALAGLLDSTAENDTWNSWLQPLPWFLAVALVFCLFTNAFLLNCGLAEFEAMFMVPLFVGSSILVSCVSGTWVMRETATLSLARMAGYWSGVSLVVLGIVILAAYAKKVQTNDIEKEGQSDFKA